MKTTAEKIAEYEQRAEALRAFERGEEIEINAKCNSEGEGWMPARRPFSADWDLFRVRIKPKLIEGWVNVYAEGIGLLHECREDADVNAAGSRSNRIRCVKVREVPGDD
jgi:hypothetical protein